jgi:putative endonuclease
MDPKRRFKYCVYMVECKYGTYYTGYTNDIKKRIAAHNNGTGAKYLRGRGPVKLVFIKKYATAKEAQSREWYLKRLPRKKKEELVNE